MNSADCISATKQAPSNNDLLHSSSGTSCRVANVYREELLAQKPFQLIAQVAHFSRYWLIVRE